VAVTRDGAAPAGQHVTQGAPPRSSTPAAESTARRSVSPEVVALVAVGAIALLTRFWARSPLWLDEALSVNIARLPIDEIPEALRHDGHPPLYYLVLNFWMRMVGTGDWAVRALSGVFGVAAVVVVWLAARRALGTRAAWAAALIAAVLPFAVRYSTEARMYSLVMLLVAGGHLLVGRALDAPRLGRLLPVAAVSGLLLLTHYWALWLVGATAVVLMLGFRAWRVAAAVIAGGVLLVPWLPSLADQIANTGTPWAGPVRPTVIVQTGLVDFGSGVTGRAVAEAGLVAVLLALLFVLGLFGRRVDDHRVELDVRTVGDVRAEAVVVAVTIGLAAVAGVVTSTTFASRYLAVVFPLVAIVCGAGLAKLPGRPAQWVVAGVFVALCLVGIGVSVFDDRTQAREVADAVAAGAGPDDVVVMCPDQLGPGMSRELPAGITQLVYPSLAGPERVDWVDYVERYEDADPGALTDEVVSRLGSGGHLWLVTAGGYNVSDECAAFAAAVGTRLGGGAVVVNERPEVFEPATLVRFGPAP
jgi:mannosyltransferase